MSRAFLLVACVLLTEGAGSGSPGRAIWIWGPPFLEDPSAGKEMVEFCRAHGVGTVFLSATTKRLTDNPEAFRSFLVLAHAQGLVVQALGGEASWIHASRRDGAAAFARAFLAFQSAAGPQAGTHDRQFDGLHLDVEPHTLPEWSGDGRAAIVTQYLDFLSWARDRATEANVALAVDVHPSYAKISTGGRDLLTAVLESVDTIAIMAYRRGPDRAAGAARDALDAVARAGKKAWVGVSLDPAHLDPGDASPEETLSRVEEALSDRGEFLGIAIHDYARFLRLSPTGRKK